MLAYIIPKALYDQVTAEHGENWPCSVYQNVAPVKIYSGVNAGSYAINTAFFCGCPTKQKYYDIVKDCNKAELSASDINPTSEEL